MRPILKATFTGALLSLAVLAATAQPGRGPMPGQSPYPGPSGPVRSSAPVYGSSPSYGNSQSSGYGGQGPTRFGPGPEAGTSPYSRQPGYPGSPQSSPYSRTPSSRGSGQSPAPADTSKMQEALRKQDFERIDQENQGLRNRQQELQKIGPELSPEDRIKLPLINHMYRKGSDTIERGRERQDPSTIKMGIQQINEANERLDHIRGPQQTQSSRGEQNSSRGEKQSRSNSGRRSR